MTQPAVANFGTLPGAEHAAGFVAAVTEMRRHFAVALEHVAEMGHAQTARYAGYTSAAAFVAELVHINRQKAARMVAQAEQVTVSVTPTGYTTPAALPTLRSALLDGVVDGEHIDAVADAMEQLPAWATLEHRELLETTLGETARTHSASVVREHGQVLLNRINQDGTDPLLEEHEAEPVNTFRHRLLPNGRIKYSGEADSETAEELLALFGPLAKPAPLLRALRIRDLSSSGTGMPSRPSCTSRSPLAMLRCTEGSNRISTSSSTTPCSPKVWARRPWTREPRSADSRCASWVVMRS